MTHLLIEIKDGAIINFVSTNQNVKLTIIDHDFDEVTENVVGLDSVKTETALQNYIIDILDNANQHGDNEEDDLLNY